MQTTFARHADAVAAWSAIVLGFTIPISVALNNVLLVPLFAGWLLGSLPRREKLSAFAHPAVRAPLVLYALLVLGAFHGDADAATAITYLKKYLDLLLIPVYLAVLQDATARRRAIYAFAAGLALTLALSYLIRLGAVPPLHDYASPENPVVFKKHLTHNILMALGVYLFARLALAAPTRIARTCWMAAAVLALFNVVAMVNGATGYVVLGALILLLGYELLDWRGALLATLSGAVLAAVLMLAPGPFHDRVARIATELQAWQPGRAADSSTGWRLEFYRNTLAIIEHHPLAGVGTGGFPGAYAKQVRGTAMVATHNPHNEFLLMAAQLGIVGLAALVWLLARQWRLSGRLADPLEAGLAHALVLTMVIGCMLNSMLLDHTEGLLYAWLSGALFGGLETRPAAELERGHLAAG